jgi:alpha-tubulin suppressor-like RCC1 family protein
MRQVIQTVYMTAGRKIIPIWLLCAAMVLQVVPSGAQPVTSIVGGVQHSLFLKSDGSLWAMGYNQYGQLGDGIYNTNPHYGTNQPQQIVASNVTAIAAGTCHSLFLKSDGSLWAMGLNNSGQLGDGNSNSSTNLPEQIVGSNVTAIAAGSDTLLYTSYNPAYSGHSLFVKTDGSLWTMGYNCYGQLGDGTWNAYGGTNRPEQIVASNVMAVAAGAWHSLFLKSDGSLWAMGFNGDGELGDGTYNSTNLPEQIVASNVMAVAAGSHHTLFLKNDGSLWAMGFNNRGQLGDGTYNNTNLPEQIVASNVTAIAAGVSHSLFLKSDGSLWAMGYDYYGQLGDGINNTTPPYFGTNRPEQIVASGVTAIAAGGGHSLFLKSDGSLWGMGDNSSGQLGDGTYTTTNRPEQILGPYNEIASQLLTNGDVRLSFVGIAGGNYALDWCSGNGFAALCFQPDKSDFKRDAV